MLGRRLVSVALDQVLLEREVGGGDVRAELAREVRSLGEALAVVLLVPLQVVFPFVGLHAERARELPLGAVLLDHQLVQQPEVQV